MRIQMHCTCCKITMIFFFFKLEQELEQVKDARETSEKQLSELQGEHSSMLRVQIKQAEMVDVTALTHAWTMYGVIFVL